MEFYLVGVKSTKNIDGEDLTFDYINTYLDEKTANKMAKLITEDDDTLEVSVHKWIKDKDGEEEIDYNYCGFRYLNKDHREFK